MKQDFPYPLLQEYIPNKEVFFYVGNFLHSKWFYRNDMDAIRK